eukprot:6467059-Amphidinium_carterae.1
MGNDPKRGSCTTSGSDPQNASLRCARRDLLLCVALEPNWHCHQTADHMKHPHIHTGVTDDTPLLRITQDEKPHSRNTSLH